VLHDLRPEDEPGLAAGPVHLRVRGRARRALPRVLRADAAGALRLADRARTVRPSDRSNPAGRAVRLDPRAHSRSCPMTRKALKSTVAIAAIAAHLVAQAGPAAAVCRFYVAQAHPQPFNQASQVLLAPHRAHTAP